MVDEVKERRKEEDAARKFFLPFENEFYHQSIQLEIEEQNILKGYLNSSRYTALLNKFWQLPEILDTRQKATFIYLVPVIHKAVGNLAFTKLCYEAMLDVEVNFKMKSGLEQRIENPFAFNDDKLKLGVNFVCGNKYYNSKQHLEIEIGPLNNQQLTEYLPGEKGRSVIEFLNEYYLPLDIENKLKIVSDFEKKEFILSGTNSALRLGYTSYL